MWVSGIDGKNLRIREFEARRNNVFVCFNCFFFVIFLIFVSCCSLLELSILKTIIIILQYSKILTDKFRFFCSIRFSTTIPYLFGDELWKRTVSETNDQRGEAVEASRLMKMSAVGSHDRAVWCFLSGLFWTNCCSYHCEFSLLHYVDTCCVYSVQCYTIYIKALAGNVYYDDGHSYSLQRRTSVLLLARTHLVLLRFFRWFVGRIDKFRSRSTVNGPVKNVDVSIRNSVNSVILDTHLWNVGTLYRAIFQTGKPPSLAPSGPRESQ